MAPVRQPPIPKLLTGIVVILLLIPPGIPGKTAPQHQLAASAREQSPGKKIDAAFVQKYESRMRGFLEARLQNPSAIHATSLGSESDLLMLPKLWDHLSPSFKTLYATAIKIPDTYRMHLSPGGHFEIFYATEDTAAMVDQTDTITIGTGQDWRVRTRGPNGVPDYIEEVAWALDSSWSLHVDRHGFIAPLPYRTARYNSSRYKVVVTPLGEADYGYTYPMGKNPDAPRGYTSLFQIRNQWKGPTWARLGYQDRPFDGVRVTCAHELFHAVQYAMTWNAPIGDDLDDFPLTFIEGTSVLMEEIAFDDINDYLQYANVFFNDPRMSLFDASIGVRAYANSLPAKFIYEKGGLGGPDISFFKRMFFANYASVADFHENLRASALASGTPWTVLLNRFHTASFYSGSRADTARFIADAGYLGQWSVTYDTLPASHSITRQVSPYGMQIIALSNDGAGGDTLYVAGQGTISSGVASPTPLWALSCIARGAFGADTIMPIPLDRSGVGIGCIDDWGSRREAIIIATNGHPTDRLAMTVSLMPCPVTIRRGDTRTVDMRSRDSLGAITLTLSATGDLRCAMEIREIAPTDVTIPSSLIPTSPLWLVAFPAFWETAATMTLAVTSSLALIDSVRRFHHIPVDSITLRRFDADSRTWRTVPSENVRSTLAVICTTGSVKPAMYGLFVSKLLAPDSSGSVAIANIGRITARQFIRFKAKGIIGIRIYATNGTLVCSYTPGLMAAFTHDAQFSDAIVWKLENGSGKTVVPGSYFVYITRRDPLSGTTTSSRHKVMVFP